MEHLKYQSEQSGGIAPFHTEGKDGSWTRMNLRSNDSMDKTGQELFRERQRRIQDAIALRVPDRVPIWFQDAGHFPAKYGGLTCEQAIFDTDRMLAVSKEAFLDFAPDMYFRYPSLVPARACEAMAFRGLKLPGCDVSPLHSHQAVEGEWRVY